MKANWKQMKREEIDDALWDACVLRNRGSLFSLSWYWDAVFPDWTGYVLGDYEQVIPWPRKLKWGWLPVLKTPLYVKWIEGDQMQLRLLLQRFVGLKKIHLENSFGKGKMRKVQMLKLGANWKRSKEVDKNHRKCIQLDGVLETDVAWSEFELVMQNHHPYKWKGHTAEVMKRLYEAAKQRGEGKIIGVKVKGQWAAMQFLIADDRQICLIQNVVPNEMRNTAAMTFLLVEIFESALRERETSLVNFMGSEVESVARFNKKFGAEDWTFREVGNH